MTWDPTDKQGWKRALERSTSPSTPKSPTKKVRFSTENDTEPMKTLKVNNTTDKNIKTVQINPAKAASGICEIPNTEVTPLRSFFLSEIQRPLPGSIDASTSGQTEPSKSSTARASAHIQRNGELYSVLQSQYSLVNSSLNEFLTSSDTATSASRSSFDLYTDAAQSSSGKVEDIAAQLTRSASTLATQPEAPAAVATTLLPLHGEGALTATAFAKQGGRLSCLASSLSSDRQGFLFGNGGDDLGRGQKSNYFDKIKNNPYTSSLLPRAPSPSLPVPQNATEARDLYKKGRYNQPKQGSVSQPTIEGLEKVLKDLHKKFAKIKAMCETAGIDAAGGIWESTVEIVERNRPDIKAALKEDTEKGLKEYAEGLERWDKAVGHHAILMKRINYQEQIAALEKKIKEAKKKATEANRDLGWMEDGGEIRDENRGEWKGHKTRLGRRFSGLIEKN